MPLFKAARDYRPPPTALCNNVAQRKEAEIQTSHLGGATNCEPISFPGGKAFRALSMALRTDKKVRRICRLALMEGLGVDTLMTTHTHTQDIKSMCFRCIPRGVRSKCYLYNLAYKFLARGGLWGWSWRGTNRMHPK